MFESDSWRRLSEAPEEVFGPGLTLRFVTPDVPMPVIAFAVEIPGAPALSFFCLDGGTPGLPTGYRKPTLPAASTSAADQRTVRRDWLLENFDEIAWGVDPAAIEYAERLAVRPVYPHRPGQAGKDLIMGERE